MRSGIVVIALICSIGFLYAASAFLIPVFFSIFLAMLIDPLVEALAERGVRRKAATYLIVGIILVLMACLLAAILLSVRNTLLSMSQSPQVEKLLEFLQKSFGHVDSSFATFSHFFKGDDAIPKVTVVGQYPFWVQWLISTFGSLFELGSFALIVPMLLFYFLYEKENLAESLNILMGRYLYVPNLKSELPLMIRRFFLANLITAASLVTAHGIALYLFGFSNWFSLAFVTGGLNVVPIVGAPFAVLTLIASGVVEQPESFPFIAAPLVLLALHFAFTNFLLPSLMGGRSNINTSALIIGSLFWSWVWGTVGFLIAIPMTLLVKILLESNSATVPIANLMAAEPISVLLHDDIDSP